jgi:hypothetical protein
MAAVQLSNFTPPANTVAIGITSFSLTGSNAQSLFDLSGTWNTTGTPTLFKANLTDTASNAASLWMDLQLGGVSKFKLAKGGALTIGDDFSRQGANGQATNIRQLSELVTIAAAADTDTTIEIPAGCILLGVTARVTVAITGTSTFDIGIAGTLAKFGDDVASTAGTTRIGSVTPELIAAATAVRITPDTTPSDAAGRVRVTLHYIDLTAAAS